MKASIEALEHKENDMNDDQKQQITDEIATRDSYTKQERCAWRNYDYCLGDDDIQIVHYTNELGEDDTIALCELHQGKLCCICCEQAIKICTYEGQFVCGVALCAEHTHGHNGSVQQELAIKKETSSDSHVLQVPTADEARDAIERIKNKEHLESLRNVEQAVRKMIEQAQSSTSVELLPGARVNEIVEQLKQAGYMVNKYGVRTFSLTISVPVSRNGR